MTATAWLTREVELGSGLACESAGRRQVGNFDLTAAQSFAINQVVFDSILGSPRRSIQAVVTPYLKMRVGAFVTAQIRLYQQPSRDKAIAPDS